MTVRSVEVDKANGMIETMAVEIARGMLQDRGPRGAELVSIELDGNTFVGYTARMKGIIEVATVKGTIAL